MSDWSDAPAPEDLHILSISLDGDIANRGTDVYQRQREYASHFSTYSVVTKTPAGQGEHIEEGSLRVLPSHSRVKYVFPVDAYRIAVQLSESDTFDVVTTQDPFATGAVGIALKRRLGASLHVQSHIDFFGNPAWRRESPKNRLAELGGRLVLQCADAVRVGTDYERRKLRRYLDEDTPISVAPVRIDPSITDSRHADRARRLRQELGIGEHPVILYAGRFVGQKNLDTWIDTARRIVNESNVAPRFVLLGDGPDRDRVADRFGAIGLSDHVHLPGWVPQADVPVYYELADVFLITSHYEGTSRVIVEAGLNEIPVVATPFAGAKDNIVDGETGYIAVGPSHLADRVVSLLEDPTQRTSMGEAARQHLRQRFDPDRQIKEYVSFLTPK